MGLFERNVIAYMCIKLKDVAYYIEIKQILKATNKNESKKKQRHIYIPSKHSLEHHIASYFEERINITVSAQCKKKELEKPFVCKLFWVDNEFIEAEVKKSDKYNDTYYILLYKGLVTRLGKCIQEERRKKGITTVKIERAKFVSEVLGDSFEDSELDILEQSVLSTTYIYLVNHELGHIVCGHQVNPENLPGYEEQNKELCADLYAFYATLSSVDSNERPFLAKSFAISVILLWSIKGDKTELEEYYGDFKLHPHPYVRTLYLLAWLKRNSSGLLGQNVNIQSFVDKLLVVFDRSYDKTIPQGKQKYDFELDEVKEIVARYGSVFARYEDDAYYTTELTNRITV